MGTASTTAAPKASARIAKPRLRARFRDSARLRLTPYFLVLALPLGIGVWAFGSYAAGNARQRTDSQLRASLAAAALGYRRELAGAEVAARTIARRPAIQRAVSVGDARGLRAYAQAHPNVVVSAGARTLVGRLLPGVPGRGVRIANGGRTLGTVVVQVPLDEQLVVRLARSSGVPAGRSLVGVRRAVVVAGPHRGDRVRGSGGGIGNLMLGDARYRAASIDVVHGGALRLAAAEPYDTFSAAEDRARRRVLLAGLAVLGGVALAAYALAPAFARTRFAQAQRTQAAQVLSHVGDGVFLVDPAGTIGFWNPGAEALTGLTAAAALRRTPDEVFRRWGQNAPRVTPADDRPVAHTGRYEVNGRELWLSVSGVDSPLGTVYAFRDLTEEHRLEETRADFVATVSHELRTPLASIHGAANTLRIRDEQLRPGTRRELLEIVFEQSERLAHLVDQILLANQLSSGTAHVERRSFDAAEAARDAVAGMRPALPREIELDAHLPPESVRAVGDPDRVRQILLNLVENALKYSPGGGRVDVLVKPEAGCVRFSVRDEGLGIPSAEQERIFEKFYRLDASMSRGVGGSGLGLFICRELVELMDGRIWVTSQPGVGSTFSFELPVSEPASLAVGGVRA
jgi:two-component system phosphate regulon sensor histidine kinase PhoR